MIDAFILANCASCSEEVLLAYALHGEDLVTCCIHCDALIDAATGRPASTAEVVDAGYSVEGASPAHGERGCRDGQCGVHQPDR